MNYKISRIEGGGVTSPKGFLASGVSCGIKPSGNKDLAVVFSEQPAAAAAAFTDNSYAAAPITVCKTVIGENDNIKAVVINSGNANAATGPEGVKNAWETVKIAAGHLGVSEETILIASTGIIGEQLPMDKISAGIYDDAHSLSISGGDDASQAILTTDTRPKTVALSVELDNGWSFTVGGMAKGSGMIAPRMKVSKHATMIAVLTTDIKATAPGLQETLNTSTEGSFNMISVDACQSTNDAVFLLANGESGVDLDEHTRDAFNAALDEICMELAKMIAFDGEGATALLEVTVKGAASVDDARSAARHVVSSDLVKTACFGNDPNWGRVIAAIGASGAQVNQSKTAVSLQNNLLFKEVPLAFDKEYVAGLMKSPVLKWEVDLGVGGHEAVAWGCDLSYDYIKINAEYTT